MTTLLAMVALTASCGGDPNDNTTDGSGAGTGETTGSGAGAACTKVAEEAPPSPSVDPMGAVTVSTLAGSSNSGSADGSGTEASFYNPVNLLLDSTGDLVVADFDNSLLRRVTPAGEVSTFADPGNAFNRPFGLTWAPGGALLVQTDQNTMGSFDEDAGTIWRVGEAGAADMIVEDVGRPRGLAPLGGRVAMADTKHHAVRLLDVASGTVDDWVGKWNCPGFADGDPAEARFEVPYGIDVDTNGDLVIADRGNHAVRRIAADGTVVTIAGKGTPGMIDGGLEQAMFNQPIDVAIDSQGRIYVSDVGNNRVRMIDEASGQVVTVAGSGDRGFADGSGTEAAFFGQEGIEVTADGSTIYLADGTQGEPGEMYHRIRVITR